MVLTKSYQVHNKFEEWQISLGLVRYTKGGTTLPAYNNHKGHKFDIYVNESGLRGGGGFMHNGRWVVNGYISHQGNTRRAQRNMGKAQIGARQAQGNTRQT